MDPFAKNPLPWSAEFDPDAGVWLIMDDNGNDFLYASSGDVDKKTINLIIKAVNASSIY